MSPTSTTDTAGPATGYRPRIHRAVVTGVRRLGPGMVRVGFGGDDLADYPTTGIGDEYVRVFFPDTPDEPVRMPFVNDNGWDFPDGVEPSEMRTYTIRGHRPGTDPRIEIDFVLHDGGIAAAWAEQARAGQVVAVNPPRGLYERPAGARRQIVVADEPGLPAALRIAELTAGEVPTVLLAEVRGAGFELTADLPDGTGIEYVWLRGGNGHGPSGLAGALRRLALDDTTYVWAATEGRINREIRRLVRHERGLPAGFYKCVAYWTDRAEEWTARFDAQGTDFRARVEAVYAGDGDLEDMIDEVQRMYDAAGL